MDTKTPQYQRAVTPSIVDSNASPSLVRGKVLSYNTNIIRGGRGTTSVSDKLFGSLNPVPSPSLSSAGATLSPRGGSGKLGTQSGKYSSDNTAGAHIDSLATAFSVLPRNDLVPISSELPSDGIIFAKTKTLPEMLVVFRTTEERLRNPERLNLDRRQLEVCPLLEQEQRLRLLNFQNNSIRVIQNLENLPNLIFLDLYNNKISSLEGPLSAVKGLRVLMAGKNKISTISNLHPLRKLDVLDLHSNEIRVIEGLDGLADLRVLNLAGNRISVVNNLSSLVSLTELNLRRNNIESVTGLNQLPALQRVFLSHNSISRLEDVRCLFEVSYLIELSLDGNPISDNSSSSSDSNDPNKYRAQLVVGMPGLRHLDLKRITEEERASASALLNSTAGSGHDRDGSNNSSISGGNATRYHQQGKGGDESPHDGLHTGQQLVLSDYDASSVDNRKTSGYSSDDGEGSVAEIGSTGAVNANTGSRDDREAADHKASSRSGAAGPSPSPRTMTGASASSQHPPTSATERKGLQKYVNVSADALAQAAGTSSAGIAHLQGLQQPQQPQQPSSNLDAAGAALPAGRSAVAATSIGLAALARSGTLLSTNCIFDLEVIGPDEKALIAVGDSWEWTSNKRLLQNVTEASFYHMKRSTIVSKVTSSHLAALPALKCLRLMFNDFSSLRSVEFVAFVFGRQIEQLTVKNCPLSAACSSETLRAYFVTSMPKLSHFNDQEVTSKERQLAEAMFGPLLLKASSVSPGSRDQEPLRAATAPTSSTTTGHQQQGKGLKNSLLRALQQQTHSAVKSSEANAGQQAAQLVDHHPATIPFLAPALQCVGSASSEALHLSLSNCPPSALEPISGSCSGLSQRALQRRRHYSTFSASFDEAVGKIILETLGEMKNL